MKYAHGYLDAAAHKGYLASAQRIAKSAPPQKVPRGQTTFDKFCPHSPAVESDVDEDPLVPSQRCSGTRDFPRYSLDMVQMKGFYWFLLSVDGKMRSEKVATEMAIDVSF